METESGLTDTLRTARAQEVPWHAIGRVLQQRLAGDEWPSRAADVWAAAEAATNIKPLILRRFLRLVDRLDRVALESGIVVADLVSPSYGAVELALRLYDRDRAAGLRALADLRKGMTTIAVLQRAVSGTPAGLADPGAAARSAALVRRARLVREGEMAIAHYARQEFGSVKTVRRPVLGHFHRIGFEAVNVPYRQILVGFDLHLADTAQNSKDSSDGLARSLLLAQQMPFFAIVFAPDVELAIVQDWTETSKLLGMWWVGMLLIEPGGSIQLPPRRSPSPNPATPDPVSYDALKNKLLIRR